MTKRLGIIQYSAALAFSGAWRGTNIDRVYEKLGWESLCYRISRRRPCHFFKLTMNQSPAYLYQLVPPYNQSNITFEELMSMKTMLNEPTDLLVPIFKTALRLLTHVGFLRQDGLILSEVFLYMERSKNQEKKYIITVQKNFTFLRRFESKNTVLEISRNLIDKLVFK